MIRSVPIRELTVALPSSPQRARSLSAASGLVVVGDFLYVVADDEHHLGVFPASRDSDGHLVRIFPGDLPFQARARKAVKPDLEALTRLPPFPGYPAGALLALPSGSRPNRCIGSVLGLDATGALQGTPRPLDLSGLYAGLELRFPALNIEGALIVEGSLLLLQRGSRGQPLNACIRVPLAELLDAIVKDACVGASESVSAYAVELGSSAGVPLSFTDAAALPDGRIVFTAVAEDSEDTYLDGPCVASAVGILAADGSLQALELLDQAGKVEGVHASVEGESIRLLLVTDADDASVPSRLLSAELPSARQLR